MVVAHIECRLLVQKIFFIFPEYIAKGQTLNAIDENSLMIVNVN